MIHATSSWGNTRSILGILMLCFLLAFSLNVNAQNFDEGLKLYERGNYKKAALIFDKIGTPEARLFTGKSYYSLGEYTKAQSYLTKIGKEAQRDVYVEAIYTLALTQFQLKQFANALEHLHLLTDEKVETQIVADAGQLYRDILEYLTLRQRKEAFQSVLNPKIRYDLIESAFGKVDYATAKILLREYKNTLTPSDTVRQNVVELDKMVADSVGYSMQVTFGNRLNAPDGIIYNIGAALPRYKPSNQGFSTAQGLYYGYILAAENFNQRNPDKKAFIRYSNTGVNTDSSAHAMTEFAWRYHVDAVLGPLYSESAQKMADLAELYEIPILAPLANSDSLNTDNPYMYQANPTFASHGRKMAQYAVRDLKLDTLAVITEKNSLGAASAYVFRDEAEKLGATVPYFFVEDLESQGFEVGEYTKYFTSDEAIIDSLNYHHVDGIYAPFTGQAARTLIDLLMVDLQAMQSNAIVMGSQEWGVLDIPESRLENRTIYFSESYYQNSKSEQVQQFKNAFSERFGIEPNRFAMIGYDAASFLLSILERVENPALLKNALKNAPLHEGLISNIYFNGKHINQEVKIFKMSDQGIQPAQY